MTSLVTRAWKGIVAGGVIAGVLDILFAFVFYGMHGVSPGRILRSVSSGLLGRRAFEGGAGPVVLGAVCQLVIPTLAAAVYFGFDHAFAAVRRHPVLSGLLYGIVVYIVMNFVVVPLSAVPYERHFPIGMVVPAVLAHMFLVGLPIALAVRKYSK